MTKPVTIRARRLTALADVAARRMGYPTWATLTGVVRKIVVRADSNPKLTLDLYLLLESMQKAVMSNPADADDGPPADVAAVIEANPPGKAGRKKKAPPG